MSRTALWLPFLPLVFGAGCAAEKADGRPWIHHVDIDGVKHVSKKDLKSKISLEATSWLPLAPKHYLDPFAVDMDKKRIESYYQAHGYFFAKVTESTVKPRDPNDKSVDIKLVVDEGPPTHIDNLTTEGLDAIGDPAQKITRQLKLAFPRGAVFDHGKYLDEKGKVETRLKNLGFAWANFVNTGEVEVNPRAPRPPTLSRSRSTAGPAGQVRHRERCAATWPASRRSSSSRARRSRRARSSRPTISRRSRARPRLLQHRRLLSSVKVEVRARRRPSRGGQRRDHGVPGQGARAAPRRRRRLRIDALRSASRRQPTPSTASWVGCARSRCGSSRAGCFSSRSRAAPTGGPSNGPSLKSDVTFPQPDFLWRNLELKWLVGYDVGIDYAYQYHGLRTTVGVSHPFWNNRVNLGSLSYNLQFLLFFNTVPEFQGQPGAGDAAVRLHATRIASAGGKKTSASTCATSRSTRTRASSPRHVGGRGRHLRRRHLHLREGVARAALLRARPSPSAWCSPRAACSGRCSSRATTARPSPAASTWAVRIPIAASTTSGCRRRFRRASPARPTCPSAATSSCSFGRAAHRHRLQDRRQLVRLHRLHGRRRRGRAQHVCSAAAEANLAMLLQPQCGMTPVKAGVDDPDEPLELRRRRRPPLSHRHRHHPGRRGRASQPLVRMRAGRHAQSRSRPARRVPHLHRRGLSDARGADRVKSGRLADPERFAAGGGDAAHGGDRRAHRLGTSQAPRDRALPQIRKQLVGEIKIGAIGGAT